MPSSCSQSSFDTEMTTDMGGYLSQHGAIQVLETPGTRSTHSNVDFCPTITQPVAAHGSPEVVLETGVSRKAGPLMDAGGNSCVALFLDLLNNLPIATIMKAACSSLRYQLLTVLKLLVS